MLPAWADTELSSQLPKLCEGGERQDLEFKECLPNNLRDLGKEIAAFATSNRGTILLGVKDSGEIIGLMDCVSTQDRDSLLLRISGVCSNSIEPPITPTFRFGLYKNRIVLAIDIERGAQPIYYVKNVPYLRHVTSARPAGPQEVIELVLSSHRSEKSDAESQFFASLFSLCIDVQIYTVELEDRQINPWLDETRGRLGYAAQEARQLAVRVPETMEGLNEQLEGLADVLDQSVHEPLFVGEGFDEMIEAATNARNRTLEIRGNWIHPDSFSSETISGVQTDLIATARQLANLIGRLETMDKAGRIDDIKSEAGEYGLVLLKAASFGLGLGDTTRVDELLTIGRSLREIETRSIYIDGGVSVSNLLEDVRAAGDKLNSWLQTL